jgi:hypothetical protein
MTLLGRDIKDIILVDNSPNSFLFQPENAYHIKSFFDDKEDRELYRLTEFFERIVKINDVRPIEDLRRKYESSPTKVTKRFVKVRQESVDLEVSNSVSGLENSKQPLKKSYQVNLKNQDREKIYNIETEPDLRRGPREGELLAAKFNNSEIKEKAKKNGIYVIKPAALTERVGVDGPYGQSSDSSEEIELPSPKESDNLINHRVANAYLENNSNETDSKEPVKERLHKPKPIVVRSSSAIFANLKQEQQGFVELEDPELETHTVEDTRFTSGINNLNSPLAKTLTIAFTAQ